ncbi:hypothetical protein LIER_33657 [Lithospermum erythrorhizon]|uniref:Reverse transcriptase domain-containing protein n=1 Tax=Lithospermum erythrorhizon TaxID=34254 RepID=A0AAV3RY82_LITER
MLVGQPSIREVKEAFHCMSMGKCRGPDGLNVEFYKFHWEEDEAVTKLLMGRMQKLMEDLISSSRSAFISGRNLGDSILMLQELVQGHHKEDGVPRAAIKIDLEKGYDMVE